MKLDNFDLFGNLNISPISLEFERGVTNTQFMGAVQAKVNELIKIVNGFDENSKNYVDEQIIAVKNIITSKIDEITILINACEKNCNKYTDEQIGILKNLIIERIVSIENLIATIQSDILSINGKIDKLQDVVISGGVMVFNPTSGTYTSVQDAINSIYNSIRVTMTWKEITALELTWQEVEELNKTWFDVEYDIKNVFSTNIETMVLSTNV